MIAASHGARLAELSLEVLMATGQLTRSETDKMIAGVAGGMAVYFGLDATLIRVLWAVAGLMGWGLLAYLILWIVLPKGSGS
jgi:phage shock protein C